MMKIVCNLVLVACFVVSSVKESVVAEEDVASISENPIEHDVKEPSLSTRGECRAEGDCCSCNKQCCSNVCNLSEKKCTCKEGGDACSFPRECCSESCENGLCASTCKTNGNPCRENAECCGNLCNQRTKTCSFSQCAQYGESCQDNTCCIGYCSAGICSCKSEGGGCDVDSKCCNGVCDPFSRLCSCADTVCDSSGTPPCCFGKCTPDWTGAYKCSLLPLNGECRINKDCQSNTCVNGKCV